MSETLGATRCGSYLFEQEEQQHAGYEQLYRAGEKDGFPAQCLVDELPGQCCVAIR